MLDGTVRLSIATEAVLPARSEKNVHGTVRTRERLFTIDKEDSETS